MDYLAAAIAVLREARQPLAVQEITDRAVDLGFLAPRGKTPVATMSACLYVACRDDERCPIVRLWQPGRSRAQRGSVRWALRREVDG
jgi:hypothetical protein